MSAKTQARRRFGNAHEQKPSIFAQHWQTVRRPGHGSRRRKSPGWSNQSYVRWKIQKFA